MEPDTGPVCLPPNRSLHSARAGDVKHSAMRPNFWTLGAGAIVASLFLFEAHRSPAVHVVPVPVVPAPAEQSPLEKGVHALPIRRGFVPPVVRTEPAQAPAASATGPSSEPSQPAVSVVPCNSLSCAMRHESLEPSWAVLTRTPGRSRAVRGTRIGLLRTVRT